MGLEYSSVQHKLLRALHYSFITVLRLEWK